MVEHDPPAQLWLGHGPGGRRRRGRLRQHRHRRRRSRVPGHTKTRGAFQRRGIATRVVAFTAEHARAAGCEWLHVDFDDELRAFYLEACGFEPTAAGLIHLRPSQAPA